MVNLFAYVTWTANTGYRLQEIDRALVEGVRWFWSMTPENPTIHNCLWCSGWPQMDCRQLYSCTVAGIAVKRLSSNGNIIPALSGNYITEYWQQSTTTGSGIQCHGDIHINSRHANKLCRLGRNSLPPVLLFAFQLIGIHSVFSFLRDFQQQTGDNLHHHQQRCYRSSSSSSSPGYYDIL